MLCCCVLSEVYIYERVNVKTNTLRAVLYYIIYTVFSYRAQSDGDSSIEIRVWDPEYKMPWQECHGRSLSRERVVERIQSVRLPSEFWCWPKTRQRQGRYCPPESVCDTGV